MTRARTLLVVTACWAMLFAGCHALHVAPWGHSAGKKHAASRKSKPRHDEPSWLAKWFEPEEPPPPQSVKEWMELEQIRP